MTDQPLNTPAEIPPELDRWNWGAFLLNWIWGIGNSVFIALLAFIPLVNIVIVIMLGLRGSRWAWRNRAWRDVEHFRSVQRKWAIAGVIIWLAFIGMFAALFATVPLMMKNSDAYAMTMDMVRADAGAKAALGDNIQPGFWVSGSINVQFDGAGEAKLSIPVSGSKASGTVVCHAIRTNSVWHLRFVVVGVDGLDAPLVLKNEDNLPVPNGPVSI
jgi:hypothetical protein